MLVHLTQDVVHCVNSAVVNRLSVLIL